MGTEPGLLWGVILSDSARSICGREYIQPKRRCVNFSANVQESVTTSYLVKTADTSAWSYLAGMSISSPKVGFLPALPAPALDLAKAPSMSFRLVSTSAALFII